MKKLLAFVFLIALAVGYSSCGGSSKSPTEPGTVPGMTPTPSRGY
jgi:hypothetical protein